MAADDKVGHPSTFQVTSNARVSTTDSGLRGIFLHELHCFTSSMDFIEELCNDCNGVQITSALRHFRQLEI